LDFSPVNKSQLHNGHISERPRRRAKCVQSYKCGDAFARELGYAIDAILEEHGNSLKEVITNIKLSRPSVSQPRRTLERLTQRSSVLPSMAEKLNVGSAGRTGPNMNDHLSMLREGIQTVPDLVNLINSAADNLGIDLDRQPSLYDDKLFWDSPLPGTLPTSVLSHQRVALDGTADEISEEQQLSEGAWLRRQLAELSRKSTQFMGEVDTIAEDIGTQVSERYISELVEDPVDQMLGEVSTRLSALLTRLRDQALDVTLDAPPKNFDEHEGLGQLHRVMMHIALQSRRGLTSSEGSQEAEDLAPEGIQEWIEVAQLHLPLSIDSSTITIVLETVPATSTSPSSDPVGKQVAPLARTAEKTWPKSASSPERLDTEDSDEERFPNIHEPTRDIDLQPCVQHVDQTTIAQRVEGRRESLIFPEQHPGSSPAVELNFAQRTSVHRPGPEVGDEEKIEFDALVMRIARILTQPSHKRSVASRSVLLKEMVRDSTLAQTMRHQRSRRAPAHEVKPTLDPLGQSMAWSRTQRRLSYSNESSSTILDDGTRESASVAGQPMRTTTKPRPVQSDFRADDLKGPDLRIARASTHAFHRDLEPGLEELKPKVQEMLSNSKMWHIATRRLSEELPHSNPVFKKWVAREAARVLPSEPMVRTDTLPKTFERGPPPLLAEAVLIRQSTERLA
jgi:hypothetical protein